MRLKKLKKVIINRLMLIIAFYFIYLILSYLKNYNADYEKSFNEIYHETFFRDNILIPDDLIREYHLNYCSFATQYISTVINLSYLRDNYALFDYDTRLKKAFHACDMKKEELFFSKIDKNKRIKLNEKLSEEEQIQLIINYYYLIDPESLLSEIKRMNYQSEDALLIMEKLEIDIDWNKNHDWRAKDEHFSRERQ